MQFAAEHPVRVSSLTLISSGGLGREVAYSMRAATLPGSASVIRVITHQAITGPMRWIVRWLANHGMRSRDFNERSVNTLTSLQDATRLSGFVGSLRSVIGWKGQRVTVLDRLDILDPARLLIIWGDRDPMLPIQHGHSLRGRLPEATMVVVARSGHEPHADDPDRIVEEILRHTAPDLPTWAPTRAEHSCV